MVEDGEVAEGDECAVGDTLFHGIGIGGFNFEIVRPHGPWDSPLRNVVVDRGLFVLRALGLCHSAIGAKRGVLFAMNTAVKWSCF